MFELTLKFQLSMMRWHLLAVPQIVCTRSTKWTRWLGLQKRRGLQWMLCIFNQPLRNSPHNRYFSFPPPWCMDDSKPFIFLIQPQYCCRSFKNLRVQALELAKNLGWEDSWEKLCEPVVSLMTRQKWAMMTSLACPSMLPSWSSYTRGYTVKTVPGEGCPGGTKHASSSFAEGDRPMFIAGCWWGLARGGLFGSKSLFEWVVGKKKLCIWGLYIINPV